VKVNIPLHAMLHKILWEEHGKIEDKIAYEMLSGQITVAEATKTIQKNYMSNRVISEETLQKMSVSQKERMRRGDHPMLGKNHSSETREKMRKSHLGQIPANKGKKKTPEEIEKDRQAQKKVPHYDCPECGKSCRGRGNLNQHLSGHNGTHVRKVIKKTEKEYPD
jgi:hypothetical protein